MEPLFTVVIPAYNREAFIAKAIRSVIQQSDSNWKLIIIDDASTDRTIQKIQPFLDDKRIRLIQLPQNGGISKVMNHALDLIDTPYFVQVDSDDWLSPYALEAFRKAIERAKKHTAVFYGNSRLLYRKNGKWRVKKYIFHRNFIDPYDFLQYLTYMITPRCFRTEAVRSVGGWDTDDPYQGRIMEDRRICLKLIEHYPFYWINQQLYHARKHGKQLSSPRSKKKRNKLRKRVIDECLKKWGGAYRPVYHFKNGLLQIKRLERKVGKDTDRPGQTSHLRQTSGSFPLETETKWRVLVVWKNLMVGGITAGWKNRASLLLKHGIRTDFLFFRDKGGHSLLDDDVHYEVVRNSRQVVNMIHNNHYDCIIVIDCSDMYPLLEAARYRGPVIVESRVSNRKYVHKEWKQLRHLQPSAIVVASHYQRTLMNPLIPSDIPVHVIPNTINTEMFQPIVDEYPLFQEEPIVPDQKKIIGWVGRISKEKNWRFFLKIAENLARQRKDVHFWIIGGGRNRKQKKQLRKEIGKLNLGQQLQWLPIMFPYQQMPLIYSKLAASGGGLVSTSDHESFGNVFVEAMACRCPVIAPRHTAIVEVIQQRRTGLLYEPHRLQKAVAAIHEVLDQKTLRRKLIHTATKDVEERFGSAGSTTQYAQLIQNIIAQHDGSTLIGGE